MISLATVKVPGMDGLLGLIIALIVFAGIIYISGRAARSIMVIGVGLVVLAVLVYFGVLDLQ